MSIVVDTSVLYAIVNRLDQNHVRTSRRLRVFTRDRAILIIPQIALIELLGHITRTGRDKEQREKSLDQVYGLQWRLEPHTEDDFGQAERRWRKYADWPADFPDLLLVATAQRLKAQSVWTLDLKMTKLVRNEVPNMQMIGLEDSP